MALGVAGIWGETCSPPGGSSWSKNSARKAGSTPRKGTQSTLEAPDHTGLERQEGVVKVRGQCLSTDLDCFVPHLSSMAGRTSVVSELGTDRIRDAFRTFIWRAYVSGLQSGISRETKSEEIF